RRELLAQRPGLIDRGGGGGRLVLQVGEAVPPFEHDFPLTHHRHREPHQPLPSHLLPRVRVHPRREAGWLLRGQWHSGEREQQRERRCPPHASSRRSICMNLLRTLATFGATTPMQYGWNGLRRK